MRPAHLAVVPALETGSSLAGPALNLPDEFWTARPVLRHIRDAARSRFASPDAVLGAVLARQSAYLNPGDNVDLYSTGNGAPMTVFAIILGHPGTGKGQAVRCATDLLTVPKHLTDEFRARSLGSGEGMIEAYYGMADDIGPKGEPVKVRAQVRSNVLFELDEGESLLKVITGRSGTTVAQMIRSAWSGENLGQANASAERDRQLLAGGYSMGLVIGFQPDTIGPLFDPKQVGGGTPHRFLFCSALDPDAPEELPPWPGPLNSTPTNSGPRPDAPPVQHVLKDRAIRAEIIATRRAVLTGHTTLSEQDTHATQFRGRIAAHLARWDGRQDVTAEDWELAGMVMGTSAAVRDSAIAHGRSLAAREAEERAQRVVSVGVRTADAVAENTEKREQVAFTNCVSVLVRRVARDANVPAVEHRQLKDASGRYRAHFSAALDYAVDRGYLVPEKAGRGNRYRVGPNAPEVLDA
ncbi:hypothetical protein [Saccharothrix sp. NRRL B-16314]|uniref:hypothetical protein n=1 Tax=Saccharothrix sp. NRRL B-16314 TaxID=1463825 RepID=UPI0005249381|nr:hypothetical protein [Saccharothrix sp. NRRL B-16314]